MTRLRWLVAGLILAAVLGFGVWSCRQRQVVVQQTQAADQQHTEGTTHEQAVESAKPVLQSDAAETARLRAEVARLRKALAVGTSAPVQEPDNPQPVQTPVDLAPLVAKQDELIGALTKENDDLKAQNVNLTLRGDSFKAEAEHLRTALAHVPTPRNLALGLIRGSKGTIGGTVEYDISRLRLGADLTTRPIAGLSHPETEVLVRVLWRM